MAQSILCPTKEIPEIIRISQEDGKCWDDWICLSSLWPEYVSDPWCAGDLHLLFSHNGMADPWLCYSNSVDDNYEDIIINGIDTTKSHSSYPPHVSIPLL
jgi:hypothetical protein